MRIKFPDGNVNYKKREVTHLSIFLIKSIEIPLVAASEFGFLKFHCQIYIEDETKRVVVPYPLGF